MANLTFTFFQLQKCEGLMDRVKAVAFTDSVHSLAHQTVDKKFIKWMRRVSCLQQLFSVIIRPMLKWFVSDRAVVY